MSGDRVILAVKFTPASGAMAVRKAVGGFLRYVQYRDQHRDSDQDGLEGAAVSGLLKYVAYRDGAVDKGRLFDAEGAAGSVERRDFAAFVADAVRSTRPRLGPDGVDRRRAVYRFVLSPERAHGLDLRRLTGAAIERLEREAKVSGLHWIAAEHRNTAHPHVHLIVAAFRDNSRGGYQSFLVTKGRLAAMKDELTLEIARQRGRERQSMSSHPRVPRRDRTAGQGSRPIGLRTPAKQHRVPSVFLQLQLAALRYRRQLEREEEVERARRGWEAER